MIMNKTRATNVETKIEIAEKRIEEAKERLVYFTERYEETANSFYLDMAQEERTKIEKTEKAILNA